MSEELKERAELLLRTTRAALRLYGGSLEKSLAYEVVKRGDAARFLFSLAQFTTEEQREAFVAQYPWVKVCEETANRG